MGQRDERRVSEVWSAATLTGLIGAAIVAILLKLVTGLAPAPLAVVSMLVFAIVTALRLRMIRTG